MSQYRIVSFTFLLLVGWSCQRNDHSKTPIVVANLTSEPNTLNPYNTSEGSAQFVDEYTQKTLTRIDIRTGNEIPVLVTELGKPSADLLSYTYTIRDDVKWDDGSPLSVEDIIFTVKVNKCQLLENRYLEQLHHIKNIVKSGENPGSFTMVARDLYYLNRFQFDEMNILQKKFWDSTGVFDNVSMGELDSSSFDAKNYPEIDKWAKWMMSGDNGHNPKRLKGLGPYELSDWQPGLIVLKRKDHFWGARDTLVYNHAYPDKIAFKAIADNDALASALIKKEIDVVNSLPMDKLIELKKDTGFQHSYIYGMVPQNIYLFIALNMRPNSGQPDFFTDKRVRKAMAYLTPVDDLNKEVASGSGIRQASFIQPSSKEYYNDSLKLIPYDIGAASKLLDEAGWKDSDGDGIRDRLIGKKRQKLEIVLTFPNNMTMRNVFTIIQDRMKRGGVKIDPDPVDPAGSMSKMNSHDYQMMLSAWSASAVPENPGQIWHTSQWKGGFNFTGFGDRYTDSLIDASNVQPDPLKRAALIKRLEAIVYEEQPYIFLYSPMRKVAISKRFENANMYPIRPGVMLNNLKVRD